MGLGIGLCCCDTSIWTVRLGQMHQFYQPWEVDNQWTASGVDGFEISNAQYNIKLERTTGDDWLLHLILLPLGRLSSIAITSETFSSPYDVLFDLPGNDVLQGVLTIVFGSAPTNISWLPNRVDFEDDVYLYQRHNGGFVNFTGYPNGLLDLQDSENVNLTHSEDSTLVYWDGSTTLSTVELESAKSVGNLEYGFGSFLTSIPTINRPFTPMSVSPGNQNFQFHDETNGRVYEQLEWSELCLPDLTRETRTWDLQTGGPSNYPKGIGLHADLSTDDPLFDDSLVSAGRTIEQQWVYMLPVYDQVKVGIQIKWSTSATIQSSSQVILDVDVDGRFTGSIPVSGATPSSVTISGRVLNSNNPSALWPVSGEQLASQTTSPKIWLPEQYENPLLAADSGFDWTIDVDTGSQILGTIRFINTTSLSGKVAIDAGSLPAGMSFSIGGFATPANRITISGTPDTQSTGSVRFKITDTTEDESGSPVDYVYKSRTYTWKISGGFEIEYPDDFSNTGTPPDSGFDWRIDGTVAVTTNYSIPLTEVGATGAVTYTVDSGTLPPNAGINSSDGSIFTSGIDTLEPHETGSCIVKGVDASSNVAFTRTYNWQYIGF